MTDMPERHLLHRSLPPGVVVTAFLGAAVALATAGLVAVFRGAPSLLLLLMLPMILLLLVWGTAYLTAIPRTVEYDGSGLYLAFAARREKVTWDQVRWYRKLGVIWRIGGGGHGHVRLVLKYARAGIGGPTSICFLTLPGEASGESLSSTRYKTILDVFVPDRRRGLLE